MAGYRMDYSMSNNAYEAYECGEMPKSKWTKEALIRGIKVADTEEENIARVLYYAPKMRVKELQTTFLKRCGWHHTSSYYNRTDFFCIDENAVEEFTKADFERIVANRVSVPKKEKSEPKKIRAKIRYTEWEGKYRKYRKPVEYTEEVEFMEGDKMIRTMNGTKRMSSVAIVEYLK